jgi:hypothetical protein
MAEGKPNLAGMALEAIPKAGEALKTIRDNLPVLEDEATVEVTGQPGSTKQELYYLALAAANGLVSRMGASLVSVAGSYGMLMIEYDAASDWVRCTLRYRFGMASLNIKTISTAPVSRFSINNLAVYRGPACNLIGGKFDFTEEGPINVLPGIPSSSVSDEIPVLPFTGNQILTPCPFYAPPTLSPITQSPAPERPLRSDVGPPTPSVNPKPPGDNRSRGAVPIGGAVREPGKCCAEILALIPMVTAALTSPATNSRMTYLPPTGRAPGDS